MLASFNTAQVQGQHHRVNAAHNDLQGWNTNTHKLMLFTTGARLAGRKKHTQERERLELELSTMAAGGKQPE